jgi:hypothetical protein
MNGFVEALYHLLCGFVFFLGRNLTRMNFNADTLVPGLVTYGICVVILHLLLRRMCRARQRPWSIAASFQVALLLPALFGISFLIPGMILQIQELFKGV